MVSRKSSGAGAPQRSIGTWTTLHILLCIIGSAIFLYYQLAASPSSSSVSNSLHTPPSSSPSSIPTPTPTLHQSESTGLKFHSIPYDPSHMSDLRFGIIFDAGSTGSRVHIYRFRMIDEDPQLEDEIFAEVKPGLSAFIPSGVGSEQASRDVGQTLKEVRRGPAAAAESLRPLLELCREQIPPEKHAQTPISLRATAGLRLLGQDATEGILEQIRLLFGSYPFPFLPSDVEVMSGSEEGVFAWITVNYLNGQLAADQIARQSNNAHPATSAILDLGGASTQIVFEPSPSSLTHLPQEDLMSLYTLPYGDKTYQLFETSYLGYGLMEARRRTKLALVDHADTLEVRPIDAAPIDEDGTLYHPCLADAHGEVIIDSAGTSRTVRGHVSGHSSCAEIVRTLFPKHPHAECTRSSCSFGGHFAMPIKEHARHALTDKERGRIYAFSYFYDRTLEIFELEEESDSTPDGTILRVERLRHLAETVCSYSSVKNVVRSNREIEEERSASLAARMRVLGERGCKSVTLRSVVDGSKTKDRILKIDQPNQEEIPDEGECMVEEKPDLTDQGEATHGQISSTLAALISENPYLCLDLTYAHTLLHYGYDLPESTDLHIMKRLEKKEIGWCLGAMLSQMAQRGW